MMGRTHKKAGAIWGVALSGILPGTLNYSLSLVSIAVSIFAAKLVDADSESSEINQELVHHNPVVRLIENTVENMEHILKYITKLILTLAPGVVILIKSNVITRQVWQICSKLQQTSRLNYSSIGTAIKLIGLLLIIFGIIPERYLKKIPLIGLIYRALTGTLHKKYDKTLH